MSLSRFRPSSRRGKAAAAATGVAAVVIAGALVMPAVSNVDFDISESKSQPKAAAAATDPRCTQTQKVAAGKDPLLGGGKSLDSIVFGHFFKTIGKHLALTALDGLEDEGIGALVDLIKHKADPDKSAEEQKKELDDINGKLDDVKGQIENLDAEFQGLTQQVTDFQKENDARLKDLKLDTRLDVLTPTFSQMNTYTGVFDELESESNWKSGYELTPETLESLAAMRSNGAAGIPNLINQISQVMVPSGSQTPTFELWSTAVWDSMDARGQAALTSHIYGDKYVEQVYNFLDYYGSKSVQLLQMYSSAMKTDFTWNGTHYPVETMPVCIEAYRVLDMIDDWSDQAALGIGRIPEGTFVDMRDQGNPLLWSDGPMRPDNGFGDYYCGTGKGYCYVDLYDKDLKTVVDTYLTPDTDLSDGPVSTLAGWKDWRVPSSADLKQLQSQVGDEGLTQWANDHALSVFDPVDITRNTGDVGSKVSMISPILIDDGTPDSDDQTYDTAAATPTASKLTVLPKPDQAGTAAGRLIAVRDFTPETKGGGIPDPDDPQDVTTYSALERLPRGTALPASAFDPAGDAKTWSKPAACTDNAYQVPDGVTALTVEAQAGAGGQSSTTESDTTPGGRGDEVRATVPVVPGTTVYIQVGGNGDQGQAGSFGGGAPGARAAGGGGISGISTDAKCGRWLIAAGGGGGAGAGVRFKYQNTYYQPDGGHGGDSLGGEAKAATAGEGSPAKDACPGGPGTVFPKNTAGTSCTDSGASGTPMQGGKGGAGNGDSQVGGGGGGGGFWFGGAGGAAGNLAGGGGGAGGVSYATDTTLFNIALSDRSIGPKAATPHVTITPLKGQNTTPVKLTSSSDTVHPGENFTLTATLPETAKGTVLFRDTVQGDLTTVKVDKGQASLSSLPITLTQGDHYFNVFYSGAGPFGATDSDNIKVTVTRETPTVRVGANPSTITKGQDSTLTATVPQDATGNVLFYASNTRKDAFWLGTAPVKNGTAVLSKFQYTLDPGKYPITALYGGDAKYTDGPSSGTPAWLTVK